MRVLLTFQSPGDRCPGGLQLPWVKREASANSFWRAFNAGAAPATVGETSEPTYHCALAWEGGPDLYNSRARRPAFLQYDGGHNRLINHSTRVGVWSIQHEIFYRDYGCINFALDQ